MSAPQLPLPDPLAEYIREPSTQLEESLGRQPAARDIIGTPKNDDSNSTSRRFSNSSTALSPTVFSNRRKAAEAPDDNRAATLKRSADEIGNAAAEVRTGRPPSGRSAATTENTALLSAATKLVAKAANQKKRPVFNTTLPMDLPANHYARIIQTGEEERVCNDILKACGQLEKRAKKKDGSDNQGWDPAANNLHNGPVQAFLQRPLEELGRLETWATWRTMRDEIFMEWLPVAKKVFAKHSALDSEENHNEVDAPTVGEYETSQNVGSSTLFTNEAVLVHVWNSPRCARNFAAAWRRVWDALVQHHINGIHCPFSVMYNLKGFYVSVSALPPLLLQDREREATRYPGADGICSHVSFNAALLLEALGIPAEECTGLPLVRGVDGRYYILNATDILKYKVEGNPQQTPLRHELLVRFKAATASKPPAAGLHGQALNEHLTSIVIPQVALELVDDVHKVLEEVAANPGGSTAVQVISKMANAGAVKDKLHNAGVNMCFLYQILHAVRNTEKAKTHEKTCQATSTLIHTEMVHRVMKGFARHDMRQANSEGREADTDHVDLINRVCCLVVSKNAAFWQHHFMPALREKYGAPADFQIPFSQFILGSTIKHLSSALGVEYSSEDGGFDVFTAVGGMVMLCPVAPEYVINMTSARPSDVKDLASSMWQQVDAFEEGSIPWVCWASRACTACLLVHGGKQLLLKHFKVLESHEEATDYESCVKDSDGGSISKSSLTWRFFAALQVGHLVAEQCGLSRESPEETELEAALASHQNRSAWYLSKLVPKKATDANDNLVTKELALTDAPILSLLCLSVASAHEARAIAKDTTSDLELSSTSYVAPPTANLLPLDLVEEALSAFVRIPHTDITFSVPHVNILTTIEGAGRFFTDEEIDTMYRLINMVGSHLEAHRGVRSRLRHNLKVVRNAKGATNVETHPATIDFAQATMTTLVEEGMSLQDPRTARVLLHYALFCAKAIAVLHTERAYSPAEATANDRANGEGLGLPDDGKAATAVYQALFKQLRRIDEVSTGRSNQMATLHADVTVAQVARLFNIIDRTARFKAERGITPNNKQQWFAIAHSRTHFKDYLDRFGQRYFLATTMQRLGCAFRSRFELRRQRMTQAAFHLHRVAGGLTSRKELFVIKKQVAMSKMLHRMLEAHKSRCASGTAHHRRRHAAMDLLLRVGRGYGARRYVFDLHVEACKKAAEEKQRREAAEQKAQEAEERAEQALAERKAEEEKKIAEQKARDEEYERHQQEKKEAEAKKKEENDRRAKEEYAKKREEIIRKAEEERAKREREEAAATVEDDEATRKEEPEPAVVNEEQVNDVKHDDGNDNSRAAQSHSDDDEDEDRTEQRKQWLTAFYPTRHYRPLPQTADELREQQEDDEAAVMQAAAEAAAAMTSMSKSHETLSSGSTTGLLNLKDHICAHLGVVRDLNRAAAAGVPTCKNVVAKDPAAIDPLCMEEVLARRELIWQEFQQWELLLKWRRFCSSRLARNIMSRKRSMVAQLATVVMDYHRKSEIAKIKRQEAVDAGDVEKVEAMDEAFDEAAKEEQDRKIEAAQKKLRQHIAARRIQCCWRCCAARFELRFRRYEWRYKLKQQLVRSCDVTAEVLCDTFFASESPTCMLLAEEDEDDDLVVPVTATPSTQDDGSGVD